MKTLFKYILVFTFVLAAGVHSGRLMAGNNEGIVIENAQMRLVIGHNGVPQSLVHKASGQECLQQGTNATAFSITQYRPYDNELQLKYPANPETYVVYWHISGEGKLKLNLDASKVCLYKQLGKKISVSRANGRVVVPLGDRHYLEIDLDQETVISAFRNAEIL